MRLKYSSKYQYLHYILLFFFMWLVMQITIKQDALDLWRYYDAAKNDAYHYSNIYTYILDKFDMYKDFIYFTTLWIAAKSGISLDIITAFFLSLYYSIILLVVKKHFNNLFIPAYVLIFVLMFAPFIWVQTISRNLAAIAICYLAIKEYLSKKYKSAVFWFLVCLFTHFSMLMYMPVFIVAHFLAKTNISKKVIIWSILGMLIFSFVAPSFLVNLLSSSLQGTGSRWESSYGSYESLGALTASTIGYGDKLPMLFGYVYSVVLVIVSKSKDYMYWCLYILVMMLSFFIFSSLMFTNRIMMLMPIFVAWNTANIFVQGSRSEKQIFRIAAILGCICILAHFWSSRMVFSI